MEENCMKSKNFYFRGSGLASIVVGFERNGGFYVWRFHHSVFRPETGKNYLGMNEKNLLKYIKNVISPFFDPNFIEIPELVQIPRSIFMEEIDKLPNLKGLSKEMNDFGSIPALEMPDFTKFLCENGHKNLSNAIFTVELKPKHGFVNYSKKFSCYCSNCLLQFLKSSPEKGGHFSKMYDFCPMELFSRDFHRILACLDSLIKNPHNNLLIFKNGNSILSNKNGILDENLLKNELKTENLCLKDVLNLLTQILTRKHSVLEQLLNAQKISTKNPWDLKNIVEKLAKIWPNFDINDPYQMFFACSDDKNANFDSDFSEIEALKAGLISATLKDCSIMITFGQLDSDCQNLSDHSKCGCQFLTLNNENCNKKFAYSIKLIDLDGKMPKKLVSYSDRLKEAAEFVGQNPDLIKNRPFCKF